MIQFQNVDENPTFQFEGTDCQLQAFEHPNPIPTLAPSLGAIFYPKGEHPLVKMRSHSQVMAAETMDSLLECLCDIVDRTAEDVNGPLILIQGETYINI